MKKNVIWITGASSGIGAELAKQYAKEGTFLILSARREKALQEVKNSCEHQENITVLSLDQETIKKGTFALLKVQVSGLESSKGYHSRSLLLYTNDPKQEVKELKVLAEVP